MKLATMAYSRDIKPLKQISHQENYHYFICTC